ncbi:MAG: nucleotidyltransferase [Vicinamibacterales bacterium]
MVIGEDLLLRKRDLLGVLERVCEGLELTDTQFRLAKERYQAVGAWLADASSPVLRTLAIYLQGSTAIGTTVKPINGDEYDVDLVAHIAGLGSAFTPASVKKAIGDRLRASGHYAALLQEMARCWRLNYAHEFHLDITPSIPNPACRAGGELVPDKTVKEWCPSNPKGYKVLFERRATLTPRLRILEGAVEKRLRADIEPYPISRGPKGILRRTVQILKRHRDHHFAELDSCLAPISVIITTLASRSYEHCASNIVYDSEFDLLCDIIRYMPNYIGVGTTDDGRRQWFIWNETTTAENFAEKWNADSQRATAFYNWHARALAHIQSLPNIEGLDRLTKSLRESFGTAPADRALAGLTADISSARARGILSVAPVVGLRIGQSPGTTAVRPNTFYGKE